MPFYHKLGTVPDKRHTHLKRGRKPPPRAIVRDHRLRGNELFALPPPPANHGEAGGQITRCPTRAAVENNLLSRKLEGFRVKPVADYLESRTAVLFNSDVTIHLAAPTASMGETEFSKTLTAMKWSSCTKDRERSTPCWVRCLSNRGTTSSSRGASSTASRLTVRIGSSLPNLPFRCTPPNGTATTLGSTSNTVPTANGTCTASRVETIDAIGEFPIHIKKQGAIHEYIYASHPFDVVGWDGYHFPYTLSIHDFEPYHGPGAPAAAGSPDV